MSNYSATSPLRPYHIDDAISAESAQQTLNNTKANILAWVQSPSGLNRIYMCPGCMGTGRIVKSAITGNPADTDLVIHDTGSDADSCRGWGYTLVAQTLVGRTQITP